MAHRTYRLADVLNTMKDILIEHGDTAVDVENLRFAGDHPYYCRCERCRRWWKSVGPDPDTDRYGPFSKEEIEHEC